MGKICPICGNELTDSANFCGKCGSRLEEVVQELRKCSKCGNELKNGVKFCSKCGTPVSIPDYENAEQSEKRNIEKIADLTSKGISHAGTVIAGGMEKGKEKLDEFQNMFAEKKKEKKDMLLREYVYAADWAEGGQNSISRKRWGKWILAIMAIVIIVTLCLHRNDNTEVSQDNNTDNSEQIMAVLQSKPLYGQHTPAAELILTVFKDYDLKIEQYGSDLGYAVTFTGNYYPTPGCLDADVTYYGSITILVNIDSYSISVLRDPDDVSESFIVFLSSYFDDVVFFNNIDLY